MAGALFVEGEEEVFRLDLRCLSFLFSLLQRFPDAFIPLCTAAVQVVEHLLHVGDLIPDLVHPEFRRVFAAPVFEGVQANHHAFIDSKGVVGLPAVEVMPVLGVFVPVPFPCPLIEQVHDRLFYTVVHLDVHLHHDLPDVEKAEFIIRQFLHSLVQQIAEIGRQLRHELRGGKQRGPVFLPDPANCVIDRGPGIVTHAQFERRR